MEKIFEQEEDREAMDFLEAQFSRAIPEENKALLGESVFIRDNSNYSKFAPFALLSDWDKARAVAEGEEGATTREGLSAFGVAIFGKTQKTDFFDLGSGAGLLQARTPAFSCADAIGASRYIGIEVDLPEVVKKIKIPSDGLQEAYLVQGELLEMLSRLKEGRPSTFYLSGIDCGGRNDARGNMYMAAVLKEMRRVMQPGNIILVGLGTWILNPEDHGFRLVARASAMNAFSPEAWKSKVEYGQLQSNDYLAYEKVEG